jgi:DNA-directed RNA polymerase subunit RPC12/RpoP
VVSGLRQFGLSNVSCCEGTHVRDCETYALKCFACSSTVELPVNADPYCPRCSVRLIIEGRDTPRAIQAPGGARAQHERSAHPEDPGSPSAVHAKRWRSERYLKTAASGKPKIATLADVDAYAAAELLNVNLLPIAFLDDCCQAVPTRKSS